MPPRPTTRSSSLLSNDGNTPAAISQPQHPFISTYPPKPVLGHDPVREAGAKASVLHDPPAYKARMRELLWPMVPSSFISTTADGQPNPDFRPRHQRVSPSRAHELITLSKRLQLEEMSIAPPQHEPAPGALSKRLVQLHGYASLGDDSSADARHRAQARQRQQSERMYLDADPRRRLEGNGSVSQVISAGVQLNQSTPLLEALNPILHVTIKDPVTVGTAPSSPNYRLQQRGDPTHSSQHGIRRAIGGVTGDTSSLGGVTSSSPLPFAFVSKGYRQGLEERAAVGLVPSFMGIHNHSSALHGGESGSMRFLHQGGEGSFYMSGSQSGGGDGGGGRAFSGLGESMSVMDEVRSRHARFIRRPLMDTIVDQDRDAELLSMMHQGMTRYINQNGSGALSSSHLAKLRNASLKKKRANKDNTDADEVIVTLTHNGGASPSTQRNSTTSATTNNITTTATISYKEEHEADAAAVFAMASGKQRLLFRSYRDTVLSHEDAVRFRDAALEGGDEDDSISSGSGDRLEDNDHDEVDPFEGGLDIHPSPSELAGYLYHSLMYDPRLPQGTSTASLTGLDTAHLPPYMQPIGPFQNMRNFGSMLVPSQAPGEFVDGGGRSVSAGASSSSRPPPGASPRGGTNVMGVGLLSGQPPNVPKLLTDGVAAQGGSALGGSPHATPSTMEALASSLRKADSQARLRSSSSMHGANAMRRLMSVRAGSRTSFGVGGTAEQQAQAAAAKAQKTLWEEASIKLIERQQQGDTEDAPVLDPLDPSMQTRGDYTAFKSDDDSCGSDKCWDEVGVDAFDEERVPSTVIREGVYPYTQGRNGGDEDPCGEFYDSPRAIEHHGTAEFDPEDGADENRDETALTKKQRDRKPPAKKGKRYVLTAPGMASPPLYFSYHVPSSSSRMSHPQPPVTTPTFTLNSNTTANRSNNPQPTDGNADGGNHTSIDKAVFYTIPMTIEDCVVGGIIVEYQPHKAWGGEEGGIKRLPHHGHFAANVRGASTAAHLHGIPRVEYDDDDANVDDNKLHRQQPKVPSWYRSFSEAMRALDSLHRVRGADDGAAKRNNSNRPRPSSHDSAHKKQQKRKSKKRKSVKRRRTVSRGGDSSSRGSVSFGDSQGSLSVSDGLSIATSDEDDEIKNMNVNTVYDLPKMVRCSPQRTTSKRGEVSTRSVIPPPSRIELHMQQTSIALAKMLKSRDVALELSRANRVVTSNKSVSPMKRSLPTPISPQRQQRPGTPTMQSLSGKRRKGSPARERMLSETHNTCTQNQLANLPTVTCISTPTPAVGVAMLGGGSRPPSSTESRFGAVIHTPMIRDENKASKPINIGKSLSIPLTTSTKQTPQSSDGVFPFSGAFGAARRTAETKFQGHRRDWKYRPNTTTKK